MDAFQPGLERCLVERPAVLDGARFGLLMNQASVDGRWRYAADVLAEAYPGQLAALFSPQHGLWGEQQANMIESPHTRHTRLGVPVYSLYSETRRPTREMLAGLECFVIDLQDVGTRIYTFVWTASHCLEACAEAGLPVLVLDRPNPLGGQRAEGPLLEPAFRSFVGRADIPMRHALTLAELLRLVNAELHLGADLHIVPMTGWRRSSEWNDTGRPWVLPSPNLPRLEGVRTYPGQVLLEGTNLSEGRGTTLPFEQAGAPFVDPERLCAVLDEFELPGVTFRPVRFVPMFDKWRGSSCGGVAWHVTDVARFRPYRTAVALLSACRRLWPDHFQWLPPPYEYETIKSPIDILTGSATLRQRLDADPPRTAADLDALDTLDVAAWERRCAPFRLYPSSE